MTPIIITLAVGFVLFMILAIWLASINNRLVRLRAQIDEAVGTLAVQFRQLERLMPDVRDTARESIDQQYRLIEQQLRSSDGSVSPELVGMILAAKNTMLSQLANADVYPNSQKIQEGAEKDISSAGRFVEAAIAEYNGEMRTFPACIIASLRGFPTYENSRITPEMRKQPSFFKPK